MRPIVLACWMGAAVLLTGCTGNPTAPTNTETYDFKPTVSGSVWWMHDLVVPGPGAELNAWLTWQDFGKNLDLYWTNEFCTIDTNTGTFTGAGCQVMSKSTSTSGAYEMVHSSFLTALVVRLFVQNVTGPSERANIHVALTPLR